MELQTSQSWASNQMFDQQPIDNHHPATRIDVGWILHN